MTRLSLLLFPSIFLGVMHTTNQTKLGLDNSLELAGVAQGVLDDHLAHLLLLLLLARLLRRGEVDVAVLDRPAARARKLDDRTLRLEEEQGFGRRQRQRGVRALAG